MAQAYAVPKHQVEARVHLPDRSAFSIRLFVGEAAMGHSGIERPSDLLNAPSPFLPAVDERGEVVFINKNSVVRLTVPSSAELVGEISEIEAMAAEEVTRALVEILLEDGSSQRGMIIYLLPESSRRMQDFLNAPEPFLVLRAEETTHLVNKRRITRVRAI